MSAISKHGRVLVLFALLSGLAVWTIRHGADAIVFHPVRGQARTPAAVGLDYEEVWLVAADGIRTQAWWMPSKRGANDGLGVTLLSFHRNAGTMALRLEFYRQLHDLGVSVFAVEYRGYGDSEGDPGEVGFAQDARAALADARVRAAARGEIVVVHGRSLGGAVAARLASEADVDGLLLEASFTSLADMADRTGIPFARHLVRHEFEVVEQIQAVESPVMIVHGQADRVVPHSMGEQLRDAARRRGLPVTWLSVPGGGHLDTRALAGRDFWSGLEAWLGGLPRPGAGGR